MRHTLVATVAISSILTLSACAGRAPNPIQSYRPGDEHRSCAGLKQEISYIESEISRLLPKTNKTGKNVGLGVAGAFLVVPWFFMDFSEAEQVEVDAYRRRYNWLAELSSDKKCGFNYQEIPDFRKQKNDDKPQTENQWN